MIHSDTLKAEWLRAVSSKLGKTDVSLLEKAVRALFLAEQLKINGLNFIFKGGTSLLLHLDKPQRFSIDVDIVSSSDKPALTKAMNEVLRTGAFSRWTEDERPMRHDLPVEHYKFFYKSQFPSPTAENYILLDVVYQTSLPHWTEQKVMQHPWLKTEGREVYLALSSIGGLLGDKLTAFAPNTTGILYTKNRPVEIIKQLFDIGCLYDQVETLGETQDAFHAIAEQQIQFRGMEITPQVVLEDAFQSALTICDRDLKNQNFQHLAKGIQNIKPHIFSRFVLEDAVVCASKTMLLSLLIQKKHQGVLPKFGAAKDVIGWLILTTDFNRFNKLKKTNPEAFFYLYQMAGYFQQS